MSLAWKCDICGDYYDPDNDENTEYLERGYIDHDEVKLLSRREVFHMCPRCSLTIDNAIDKRRKKNEHT